MLKFLAKFFANASNRYESGLRWSKDRTYLPGYVQDARFDADNATRSELVRKSRWFEKNDAIAQRLAELFVEFTVGPNGPPIVPASSDDEWNQRASDYLYEWYPMADLSTRFGYGGLMTTAAWRRFFDGEYFLLKTGENGRPRVQGISGHRVGTPPDLYEQEGRTIIEGVKIDSRGRPEGYYIQEGINADNFTFKTTNQVIHIFEPESPGQYRGLPLLTPVINDLNDLNDLQLFEMRAAKEASSIATVLKTPAGEFGAAGKIKEAFMATKSRDVNGVETMEQQSRYISQRTGGRNVAIPTGSELDVLTSDRPTVTQQWHWQYVAQRVCIGTGIPMLLVFPSSIQGTIGRGEYDLAATYFRSRHAPFAMAASQLHLFVIGLARFSDLRIADAPADWTRASIRAPRAPNVDVGRNAAAAQSDVDACLSTLEEQFGQRGLDWREQVTQRGREEQFIDSVAEKLGLSPDRLRKSIGESLKLEMEKTDIRREKEDAIDA